MKTICPGLILLFFVSFTLPAADSDVILRAQQDALEDGRDCHAIWWGVGGVAATALPVVLAAFFMGETSVDARRLVALAAPPLGGSGIALVGYFTGKADIPDARTAEIEAELNDTRLRSLYVTTYEQTLTKERRRRRGNAALIGAGASIGVMGLGFLVVYVTK